MLRVIGDLTFGFEFRSGDRTSRSGTKRRRQTRRGVLCRSVSKIPIRARQGSPGLLGAIDDGARLPTVPRWLGSPSPAARGTIGIPPRPICIERVSASYIDPASGSVGRYVCTNYVCIINMSSPQLYRVLRATPTSASREGKHACPCHRVVRPMSGTLGELTSIM